MKFAFALLLTLAPFASHADALTDRGVSQILVFRGNMDGNSYSVFIQQRHGYTCVLQANVNPMTGRLDSNSLIGEGWQGILDKSVADGFLAPRDWSSEIKVDGANRAIIQTPKDGALNISSLVKGTIKATEKLVAVHRPKFESSDDDGDFGYGGPVESDDAQLIIESFGGEAKVEQLLNVCNLLYKGKATF